jgi:putative peptidoglycan lipid II flippase
MVRLMDAGSSSVERAPHAVARHRGLVARTVLVSGLTLLSRLLGFVREALMAAVFGDRSVISDAFITAWRVPNLFRRLLGEGALSVSLQSAMTKADLERGDVAGRALFRATLRLMTRILLAVTVLGMLVVFLLPDSMPFTGWAWLGPAPGAVRDLTVRVLPYVVLVCAAAICGGALAVRGHFALPNLAPTAMNLVWIGTLVGIGMAAGWGRELGATEGEVSARQWELARWLAWGLLLGGTVQLVIHLPPLRRFGLVGDVGTESADPWHVLRSTAPLVIGAAIYQINVMVDGLMATSLLRPGGSSAIYYANRFQQFPLALVSTAAVNAVFPLLNAHGHLGERARVRALHDRTQLAILFLALPAAAGMFALALPIASVCYEHGNFGLDGAERVASGLRWLAVALIPAGALGLTSRTYVAMGDLRTPVRVAVWMVLLNVVLNALCVVVLGLDVAGLTLSTAVTAWINVAWLARGFRTKLGLPASDPGLRARIAKIALASLACALAAWGAHRVTASALGVLEVRRSIPALLAGLTAGGLALVLASHALAIPEWHEILRRLGRRGRGATDRAPS